MKKILSGIILIASSFSALTARALIPNKNGGFDVGPNALFSVGDNAIGTNGALAATSGDQVTDTIFSSNVYWDNAPDISLINTSTLTSVWTFHGANRINGNGTTLYMGDGGQLVILPGSSLAVSDVTIRGLKQDSFIFFDATSTLTVSNTDLELAASMTTTVGVFYVDQSSSIIIRNFNFCIDDGANMTIDSVDFWVDTRLQNQYPTLGQFCAPLPMFPSLSSRQRNWNENILSGHLSLINTATVRDFYTEYLFGTANAATDVVNGVANVPEGSTYPIAQSNFLSPDTVIRVSRNMTLDGRGGMLIFSRLHNAQLIVDPGVTLTLKNIQLSRIGSGTISIGEGATVDIGAAVSWELSEDVTLSEGTINLTSQSGSDIFTIRGLGGRKRFNLVPASGTIPPVLNVGPNVLSLQEIEFTGIEQANVDFLGQITLGGGATVNLYEDSNLSFEADDLNNYLVFFKDTIRLTGFIYFGDHAENHLNMKFSGLVIGDTIPEIILGAPTPYLDSNGELQTGATLDVASFSGGGVVSATGRSYLTFENQDVIVTSEGAGSFRIGEFGLIEGKNVQIEGYPILQASSNVIFLKGTNLSSSTLSNIIDRTPSSIRNSSVVENISNLSPDAQAVRYYQALHGINSHLFPTFVPPAPKPLAPSLPAISAPASKPSASPVFQRPSRSPKLEEERALLGSRTIPSEPSSSATWTFVTVSNQVQSASGNYRVDNGGILTQFGTSATDAAVVKLNSGGQIQTASSGTTTIKSGDAIFAVGSGNILQVNNAMVINGNIVCEDSSDLTIQMTRGGSLTITSPDGLVIGDKAKVTVKADAGGGAFILADGSSVTFQSKDTSNLPSKPSELIFTSGGTLKIKDSSVTAPITRFQGVGQLRFATNGAFDTTTPCSLIFGTADSDNMVLRIETSLTLNDVSSGNTTISFAAGKHGFVVSAPLSLGKNVSMEFNMLNSNYVANSKLHSFIVNYPISISASSALRFATNLTSKNLETSLSTFDGNGGSISGKGQLLYSSYNTISKTRLSKTLALNNDVDLFRGTSSSPLVSDLIVSLSKIASGDEGYDFYKAFDGTSGLIGLDILGRTSFVATARGDTITGLGDDGVSVLAIRADGSNVAYRF